MSGHMHPNIMLGEIKLKVSNLQRSLDFYTDIVGFRVLHTDGAQASLTYDGVTAAIVLEELPGARITPRRAAAGLYHFAILLPDRLSLGITLRHLVDHGIRIGQADHLVSEALYIYDPDNHGIELYRDRARDEWQLDSQGNIKMASDPIDWDGLLELAQGHEWHGLPNGTTLGHIHLHVSSLEQSKAFYVDTLGFDIAADARAQMRALFIATGGYHHHIGLNSWAGEGVPIAPADATGLAYYTILLPDHAALQETVGRLKQAGITVTGEAGHCLVHDPSGIELRLASVIHSLQT